MDERDGTGRPGAVALMQEFGFTEYQARAFVSLLELGTATAKQVSEASEVPRTRVYDAMEQLHDRGLVDIQYATPKVYAPPSREAVVRRFERETDATLRQFESALDSLETGRSHPDERGVWTVAGREAVVDRLTELVVGAEASVDIAVGEGRLTDDCLSKLAAAGRRGVTVRTGRVPASVGGPIDEAVPGAESVDAGPDWAATPVGTLLLVDGRRAMVSVVPDGADAADRETAVWGSGRLNPLVVVLRAVLAGTRDAA